MRSSSWLHSGGLLWAVPWILLNRLPTKTVLGYMSPYECVYGAAPDLKWLRIWGCKCYVLKRNNVGRENAFSVEYCID